MMVRLTLALLLSITCSQTMADTWIKDGKGCQVLNPNPKPDESVTWSGECRDGYAEGPGVLQWTVDGRLATRYEGNFVHGAPSGKATAIFSNGNRYEGDFVDGKMRGNGTFTSANGNRYEGEFLDNHRNGKGILTLPNGERYEGDFVDDKSTGKGVVTRSNGDRYEGDFVDSKVSGKGTYAWSNGSRYEGDFVDGKMSGNGTFTWEKGDRYEGEFLDGRKTGKGTLTRTNGDRYQGDFLNDNMTGKGVLTSPGGYRWEGEMLDGKQVKTYSSIGKREDYSIKDTYTGSNIARRDVSGISVPPNKPYRQLTPEEKQIVKSQYFSMADADEPPYPVNGQQALLEAVRDLQRKLAVLGTMSVFVDIDAKGNATAVEVEKSPDEKMLKAVAAVLMLQKYKPAVCKGSPCNMQFPFRMEFKREL